MIWTLLAAAAAMAFHDAIQVLLTIAEARGRALLAGLLDSCIDVAKIPVMVFGAGEVITHGWDIRAISVIGTMAATSFATTGASTWWGRRIKTDG